MCDKVKSDFKADIVNSVPAADCEKLKKEDTIKAEVREATHCSFSRRPFNYSSSVVCGEKIVGGCKVSPLL